MITRMKEIGLPTWCQIALVGALISAGGLLFAQTHKKIDTKAKAETVAQMLEVIKINQAMQKEQIKEQKKVDTETLKALQKLTEQIIILNEQIKRTE